MALEDRLHTSLNWYMAAPPWIRDLAGRFYRVVPQRIRLGSAYVRFSSEAGLPTTGIRWEQVAIKLEATLAAAATAPAYAAHAAQMTNQQLDVFQRLRALPLVTKADIKAHLLAYVHPDINPSQRMQTFTGGSTAQPMTFYLHRHMSRPKETAYVQHINKNLLGAAVGDWTLSLRGRTVASAATPTGRVWATEPIKRHLLFSSDHLEPRYMPAYVEALMRLRPRQIHAYPSALYPLARWFSQHPSPEYTQKVVGILLTSENVYDFQLALFHEVFPNAQIVRHYGHSERVLMSTASGLQGEAEFFPLYGLPELVDEQGLPIERPGVLGEIVGTSFDNHVMPFVRYRTGDMGMWSQAPSYLDKPEFKMRRIEGRCQEFIVCTDHRLVSIATLGAAHFHELNHVDQIQFEQSSPGLITLKVVSPAGLSNEEKAQIATAVRNKTQGGCEVVLQTVPTIERTARGKHRMLVQHLDLSQYLGAAITPEHEENLRSQAFLNESDVP
jgi:phenylacetate-CoA ligase